VRAQVYACHALHAPAGPGGQVRRQAGVRGQPGAQGGTGASIYVLLGENIF
jgi:hypothetical protein